MTGYEFLIGGAAVLTACGIGYLNLAKFGHLPDKISLAKIKKSSHQKNGKFHNIHQTAQMTGQSGFFGTMWDFYCGNHLDTKPRKNIPTVKNDIKNLDPKRDQLVSFRY